MKMTNQQKWILGIVGVMLVGSLLWWSTLRNAGQRSDVTLGVITDLSGSAAYWGNGTRAGAELAVQELQEAGYNIRLIFEDYQLDPKQATSAAQKLVNIDRADGIYAEFNPGAVAAGSVVKGQPVLYVYDAAIISPLEDSPYAYKTYLDYQAGCRAIAEKLQEQGISRMGLLKGSLEFGELCFSGVKDVYGDAMVVEGYNLGDQDFKTHLTKLRNGGAQAVINVGFEGETLATLRGMTELGFNVPYGTVTDTISPDVTSQFGDTLRGGWSFGFSDVDPQFVEKLNSTLPNAEPAAQFAAALAYTHVRQMSVALSKCGGDMNCAAVAMDDGKADGTIGFNGFNEHIADLDMELKQY